MRDVAVVIPARLGSTRLKKKPLAPLGGRPMVVRVAELAREALPDATVIVATDSQEILDVVSRAGFEARMTSPNCASGTDRVAEVAKSLQHPVIVNLQGDEPLMSPITISAAAELVRSGAAPMASCYASFRDREQYLDPSQVKVILNGKNEAIYFSRAQIPYRQKSILDQDLFSSPFLGRHLGLYAYARDFLLRFAALPPAPLEELESLEQLRALAYGFTIAMAKVECDAFGINTPEELERAQALFIG